LRQVSEQGVAQQHLGYRHSRVGWCPSARTMSDEPDSGEPKQSNRRKHRRTPLSLLVQYRLNSFEDFLAEYTQDLSPGGMFIRTDEPREMGSMIYLQFQLKDGSKLIEGLGRVCWVNEPGAKERTAGMGVEFVNFDDESMALIEEICTSKQKKNRPKN
jgi:type IV pilus assembly protein PilZ